MVEIILIQKIFQFDKYGGSNRFTKTVNCNIEFFINRHYSDNEIIKSSSTFVKVVGRLI